jgi:hypothetical protein
MNTPESSPFRIPEKCIGCLSIQACLKDFETEQTEIINWFRRKAGTLEEAESILLADEPDSSIGQCVAAEIANNWREAGAKIVSATRATQAIFDDVAINCPGKTPETDCNYPDDLA